MQFALERPTRVAHEISPDCKQIDFPRLREAAQTIENTRGTRGGAPASEAADGGRDSFMANHPRDNRSKQLEHSLSTWSRT